MINIEDITEKEFSKILDDIMKENASESDEKLDYLLDEFERITGHPEGSDLIYYPRGDNDGSKEKIIQEIKKFREKNGLTSFKTTN